MDSTLEPLPPIFTAHLFPKLEAMLIELLRSLAPQDWEKQTLAPKWKVKDVAAHLLDTQTAQTCGFASSLRFETLSESHQMKSFWRSSIG